MKHLRLLWLCLPLLFLFSCGSRNPFIPNESSVPSISFQEDKIPLDSTEYIYRQTIEAPPGPDTGNLYSFRLTSLTGKLPEAWFCDEDQWLWFRKPGSDPALPLSEAGPHRTIWTSKNALSLDFYSTNGKINNLIKSVEIRIKQADQSILSCSSAFQSNRLITSRIEVPFANGVSTGQGLEFGLREVIGDIFVDGLSAHHFMYRINEINAQQDVIYAGSWHSSLDSPDIRKVRLNANSSPALAPNPTGIFTQFESYVVSRQGIVEAGHHTVYFRVTEGFSPQTLIYSVTLAGLGQYHYSRIQDSPIYYNEVIPTGSDRKNLALWKAPEPNTYEAIHSDDFILHLKWGQLGEYGWIWNGDILTDNASPFDTELNLVLDADTGENYHSKIAYFDLRLDGAPFPTLSQFVAPILQTDNDGTQWLRVRNINPDARHCQLSDLSSGTHYFQARAVDLAGTSDSSPAFCNINLQPYVPASARSGILLVDDCPHHSSVAPEAIIDGFYNSVTPQTFGTVDYYNLLPSGETLLISPVQMMNYKAVLWYSDNSSQMSHLRQNLEGLDIYLDAGGNLAFSGTNKLSSDFENVRFRYREFAEEHLGLLQPDYYAQLSSNSISSNYFIDALGLGGLPDLDLNLETPFNNMVASRQGLASVTYFRPGSGLDYLYQFGCKLPTAEVYPPTQAQYEFYSSQYVAYQHNHNQSRVVVFGFPLSYMESGDVSQALTAIFTDIINGGKK